MNNDLPLPKARTSGLIVKELPDETLVYDLETDKAHCLNRTATWVWNNCDGKKTVKDLSASLAREMNGEPDESLIWLALDQLERFNLMVVSPTLPVELSGISRRQWVRKIGVAALTLPMIVSIVTPVAAQAASCGQVCGNPNDCLSNPVGCRNCVNPGGGAPKICAA